MRPFWTSLLCSIFFNLCSFAALEPSLDSALAFYKNVGSPFPSGQAKKSDLLNTIQSSVTDFQFRVSYNQKNYFIQHDSLIREIELTQKARTKSKVALSLLAEMGASRMDWIKKDERVDIISQRGAWARVKTQKNQIGYLLISDLEADPHDVNTYLNLIMTPVFEKAHDKSPILFQLSPFTKIQLIKVVDGFGYFKTQTRHGYIPMSQVIGRSDFAEWGWNTSLKRWQPISYRNGSMLVVKGQIERSDVMNFSAFRGRKNAAVISQVKLPIGLGARVQIEEALANKWNESYLKGHGLVWWKTDLTENIKIKKTITTAELMKKNLSGISFDSRRKKGLASAGGIYHTKDGKRWSKLDYFGNQDWPVLIHNTGVWFVGSYKSSDEGESFQPFLKWSEIIKKIQSDKPQRKMPFLKVVDLSSLNSQWMKLKIDTGVQLASIKADPISNEWQLIP